MHRINDRGNVDRKRNKDLIIRNLTVSYDGQKVLDNLDLEIGNGITCIMGESGIGKTTLLRVIAGLIDPDHGAVTGAPQKPSVLFQEDRLFPWLTALENVKIVCNNEEKSKTLLKSVELEEAMNKLPSELSGGMKRRVALARALSYEGDMLILDEPFKGLDEALTERIVAIIKKCAVPVIVSTHAESDVELLGAELITIKKQ